MQSHFKQKVLERLRKIKGRVHVLYFEFKDLDYTFKEKILPFLKKEQLIQDDMIKNEIYEINEELKKIDEIAEHFKRIKEVLPVSKDYEILKVQLFGENNGT